MRSIILALAIGASTIAATGARKTAPASAQPETGEALYLADGCYECHGRQGQGGRGPALAGTRLPYEAFRQLVREPLANMPPYGEKVLSDDELGRIYAHVKAFPGPLPADKLPDLLRR